MEFLLLLIAFALFHDFISPFIGFNVKRDKGTRMLAFITYIVLLISFKVSMIVSTALCGNTLYYILMA